MTTTAPSEPQLRCDCNKIRSYLLDAGYPIDGDAMLAVDAVEDALRIESALASAEPVAPWLDHAGNAIRSGDRIAHPDGTMGTVVFVHGFDHASEAWRVVYDGSSQLCRLILQVGEKGMASVVTSHAKPAAKVEARYECRECGSCGHAGINDASTTQSACFSCEWSGPEPGEDKCPGCGEEGCMTAACPECGARYRFVAELEAEPPGKTPASVPDGYPLSVSEAKVLIEQHGMWIAEADSIGVEYSGNERRLELLRAVELRGGFVITTQSEPPHDHR